MRRALAVSRRVSDRTRLQKLFISVNTPFYEGFLRENTRFWAILGKFRQSRALLGCFCINRPFLREFLNPETFFYKSLFPVSQGRVLKMGLLVSLNTLSWTHPKSRFVRNHPKYPNISHISPKTEILLGNCCVAAGVYKLVLRAAGGGVSTHRPMEPRG